MLASYSIRGGDRPTARKRTGYIGWELPAGERARLLALFPPAYDTVVAHHVTLAFGVRADAPLPAARAGRIIGIADDGEGVQALVVEIEGATARPDGSTFHVTWSLGPGRRPVEANQVIRERGWRPVESVPLSLIPRFFPLRP